MARDLGSRILQAHALRGLGEAYLATSEHHSAAAELNSALDLYRELGSRLVEAYTLPAIAATLQAIGDNQSASEALACAFRIEEALNRPRGQAYILNSMGDLAMASGLQAQARVYYEQARAIASHSRSVT